jgi:hypothetical protein
MKPPILKLITKDVTGLPWDNEVEVNYFRCILVFGDEEINPSTIWAKTEEAAINESLSWLKNEWKESPRDYTSGYPFPPEGKASRENYQGYVKLREPRTLPGEPALPPRLNALKRD